MIRFRGKRKDWMRHRGHVAFGCGIKDIAYKKVALFLPIWQQGRTVAVFRDFTHHDPCFVFSHTRSSPFVISHTGRRLSCLYTQYFVSLHTHYRDSAHGPLLKTQQIQVLTSTYQQRNTLYNTYLTLWNCPSFHPLASCLPHIKGQAQQRILTKLMESPPQFRGF